MSDRTSPGRRFGFSHHAKPGPEMERALSPDAALELLYVAAVGGAFSEGEHADVARWIALDIEVLADAIRKAWGPDA